MIVKKNRPKIIEKPSTSISNGRKCHFHSNIGQQVELYSPRISDEVGLIFS